jgi:hypothetical protein
MAKHSTTFDFDDLAALAVRRRHWFLSLVSRLIPPPKSRWWRLYRWLEIDPDAAHNAQFKGDERMIIGMIASMTPSERHNPASIDHSRQRRIAAGSGVSVNDVSNAVACVTNWPDELAN